jgi:diguanylate cyclase (GGDEF)-like protein
MSQVEVVSANHGCECGGLVASYERLTALYHDLLGRDSLADLLGRAASAVGELVPCSSLLIAEADREQGVIVPLLATGEWEQETLQMRPRFGEGLIGWTVAHARPVLANEAHCDPRAGHVAGTPAGEPESIICLPLVADAVVIGALSLYREGDGNTFTETEFTIARHFADAMALALTHARDREQLRRDASTDPLTGCLNRRGFEQALRDASSEARSAGRMLALLLVDLDQFKTVNDRLGHRTGDLVLCQVATQLRAAAPADATVSRLGGDEFALLLTPATEADLQHTLRTVAEAMRQISFLSANGSITISGSIGLAHTTADQPNIADYLLRGADEAMYANKRQARTRLANPASSASSEVTAT